MLKIITAMLDRIRLSLLILLFVIFTVIIMLVLMPRDPIVEEMPTVVPEEIPIAEQEPETAEVVGTGNTLYSHTSSPGQLFFASPEALAILEYPVATVTSAASIMIQAADPEELEDVIAQMFMATDRLMSDETFCTVASRIYSWETFPRESVSCECARPQEAGSCYHVLIAMDEWRE